MAAVVGGLSRLFQPTIGVLSGEKVCQGINPWYFLIGLRLVTLFFALGPCESLRHDLICQWPSDTGDAKTFCSALCYNQHFPIPISSIWVFHFITIIFIVALMKFVHVTEKDSSAKDVEAAMESKPGHGTEGCCDPAGPAAFSGWRYGIYIFCIVLILTLELSFIWILLGLQLPIMNQAVVVCHPNNVACPPSAQCALNVQSDKRTALWSLAFCAAANASVCVGYLAVHGGQAYGCRGGCGSKRKARAGFSAREACPCNRENCCCQGNEIGRDAGCGCQGNRQCPCFFQGNEVRQSQNLVPSNEDSEGKLLRGDTELGGERKDWRPDDGRIPMREPLRIGAKKGQDRPGREGRVIKHAAKYQAWGKQRM
ncbi:hypothetical protein JD844_001353 [Phrynosoma platyrhinos]|uniref:Connexin N-terminal domain-containing protein n=1 Tax=Phrynosoma platyrhinos TaxID=52577 RepID=A0ABQ7T9J9_PHRPL|nr:hypothetical protein JD844_001353 [Phrynosoma platyrhinos]